MEKLNGQSADVVADNIDQLKALFPEALTEGKIDFDTLKQLLGGDIDEREEKYGLNWHGKRRARQLALTPSTGTLRPSPEESVDWDTTQNLMIEGDNLEVLKLLQKSYAGKVKLIYIDPPYNTGNDFVYPDNFQDNIKNYLELTGQVEGGAKISSNTEASGRFHTDWLNMVYPRLKLARNLLSEDGVLFISINYRELAHVLRLCDEIFGEENFVGNVTWKARVKPVNIGEAKYRPQGETEYVVIYQKSDKEGKFQPLYTGGVRSYPHEINGRKYRLTTILKSNRGANFRNTMSFEIDGYAPPDGQRWQGGEEEIKRLNIEGYLEFRDGTPFKRYYEDEEGAEHDPFYCFMESDWSSTSEAGKAELNEILGNDHGFDTVKPTRLLKTLIQSITNPGNNEIVVDFFAGSGTTGHAVMAQNSADGGNRRYVLVQLPEPLDPENKDQKTAANFCDQIGKPRTIAELTKERLRRAAKKVKDDNTLFAGDLGFRVFKLDSSNIRAWEPNRDDLEQTLLDHAEHIVSGRSEQDILYELLLKLGLDLTVPIEQKPIAGKTVHSIGAGALLVCLSDTIDRDAIEPLAQGIVAWHNELKPAVDTRLVFRDSAFADDVAKTNLTAILQQQGLDDVRSL
ncbi:site-specific DNA-methyltransferase [Pelobacter propionicus]|uniref:site-specific DNA-methyltransferase (adenine-specific) n=1 Tax=Pelobacter propionicus (strain DSM 2379 / NBRC 103807 / OttBd1) TaxID=338966 RepID=A1AKK2_PELPD|nr:site-specific DNA-methyltransferase [Pelobacter propionicus]ABK97872.1 DNA methylase N-4/N-6 domain protein [Pelobacter propionicus DSM 2379]